MKLNISVVEGGERLYVTPIQYDYKTNQFLPFMTQTGRLDASDYIKDGFHYRYAWGKLSIFQKCKTYFRKLIYVLRRCREYRCFKNFPSIWRFTVFIWCSAIYDDNRISIQKQLCVIDPNQWSDTYYLTPSFKYLKKQYSASRDKYKLKKITDDIRFITEIDT